MYCFRENSNFPFSNQKIITLSIVSKVLEKAVYKQLEKFLTSNNLMYEFQSGFRSSYSTDSCLIHLIDHIKSQTAKGLFTGMVLLDKGNNKITELRAIFRRPLIL
jgi:hypothetical protein